MQYLYGTTAQAMFCFEFATGKIKWEERRAAWAARAEQDRGAVVLLGDSITQGWGEDFSAAFPGVKIAKAGDAKREMNMNRFSVVVA